MLDKLVGGSEAADAEGEQDPAYTHFKMSAELASSETFF